MADFDQAAELYDFDWTDSLIGRSQRDVVWQYVQNYLPGSGRVLELACGTGEDARFLAKQGWEVLATDGSAGMLAVAAEKCRQLPVDTCLLDLEDLSQINLDTGFDLIFSNFGGLNCLAANKLADLDGFAQRHLRPQGEVLLVMMPKDTLLDRWYRSWKGEVAKRRSDKNPIEVDVAGRKVRTYYHNPGDVCEALDSLKVKSVKPTGFLPSYFEDLLNKRPVTSKIFHLLDRVALRCGLRTSWADHYLLHLVKN